MKLVCLGNFNGSLKVLLEPKIENYINEKMIEEWINKQGLHHLNQSEKCVGTYTYGRPGKPRSTIDHILVNNYMEENFKGMNIDENAEEVNMSDHNLIRAWFKIGRGDTRKWEKKNYEIRTWYKKDEESLKKMEEELLTKISGPTSFNSLMDKIEIAQDRTLKAQKKMRTCMNGGERVVAAEWVNDEVQSYLKERKNKIWREAR